MAKTTSNNSLLVCLFYLTVCVSFTCSIINDARIYINDEFFKVGMDAHRTFGGRAKYLTYINLVSYSLIITLNALSHIKVFLF